MLPLDPRFLSFNHQTQLFSIEQKGPNREFYPNKDNEIKSLHVDFYNNFKNKVKIRVQNDCSKHWVEPR